MADSTVTQFRRSEQINELAAALAKAQGAIENAEKGNVNPHFKSKYADLASVWDACRSPLSANGLSVLQPVTTDGVEVTVTTLLLHSSGQFFESVLACVAPQATPQGIGSCITYLRRYSLSSMVGIAPADDDVEAATRTTNGNGHAVVANGKPAPAAVPEGFENWVTDMRAVADEGTKPFYAALNKSRPDLRLHLTTQRTDVWEALKGRAATATPAAVESVS